jgi:DNA-binding transcriptional LysR family regulator
MSCFFSSFAISLPTPSITICADFAHELAKRKRVRLREVADEDFVMYERTWAPGFHDLIFGILRDAGIVLNVTQTAGEVPTLISLVHSHMGITIMPLSAVKHSVASVVACNILDRIPMSEIGIAVSKGVRTAVVDNFKSFALKTLGHSRNSLSADRS